MGVLLLSYCCKVLSSSFATMSIPSELEKLNQVRSLHFGVQTALSFHFLQEFLVDYNAQCPKGNETELVSLPILRR